MALLHSCVLPRRFSLFVRRDPGMSQLGVGLTSWRPLGRSKCDQNTPSRCRYCARSREKQQGLDRLDLSHERRTKLFVWNLSTLDLGLTQASGLKSG